MPSLIYLKNITAPDAKSIFDFFKLQSKLGVKIWKAGEPYIFRDNITFTFPCTVIQRNRKKGKIGVRYEFISNDKIGYGGSSSIYNLDGRLAITSECDVQYKQYGSMMPAPRDAPNCVKKERIVKIQENTPIPRVLDEYTISLMAEHLSIKPPTFVGTTSYMVMKKLRGRELLDIVNDDNTGKIILSLQQRLSLSRALLKALKEQVTDKGIIHGDIKVDNILVDMVSRPISVHIIDYGFSATTTNPETLIQYTKGFSPPESYTGGPKTQSLDVFSMARCSAL